MTDHLGQLTFMDARARVTDPRPSHLAAKEVQPGNTALIQAIRAYCWAWGPSTAWEIADAVSGERWEHATVRSACARAGLMKLERAGERELRDGRRRKVTLYALPVETVETSGRT